MGETVRISFEGTYEEPSPFVVVYNPRVLPGALFSQILRFGLINTRDKNSTLSVSDRDKNSTLSGKLKGNRKAFTEMIQSYGVNVEIVPATAT